jgi:biotin operon repressor
MSFMLSKLVWGVDLPQTLKYTLLALADYADDSGGGIFPSKARLAEKMGCSEKTASRNVNDLETQGYIVQVGVRGRTPEYKINTDKLSGVGEDKPDNMSGIGEDKPDKLSGVYGQIVGDKPDNMSQYTDNMSQYTDKLSHYPIISYQNQSSETQSDNLSSPTRPPDDDFFQLDNLAIEGLFKTAFKREPKPQERDAIGQMLLEPCGNERLTAILMRIIGSRRRAVSVNYLQTAMKNEPMPQKIVETSPARYVSGEWAHLIES